MEEEERRTRHHPSLFLLRLDSTLRTRRHPKKSPASTREDPNTGITWWWYTRYRRLWQWILFVTRKTSKYTQQMHLWIVKKKTLLMSNTNDFWMDSRSMYHTWTNIEGVLFPSWNIATVDTIILCYVTILQERSEHLLYNYYLVFEQHCIKREARNERNTHQQEDKERRNDEATTLRGEGRKGTRR